MIDAELILGCQRNDRDCQKKIYDKYSKQMFNICLRYCHDQASAADALQEGFIKVYRYINSYKNTGNLYSWIKKIIVRSCLDQIQKEKLHMSLDMDHVSIADHHYELKIDFDDYTYNRVLKILDGLATGYKVVFSMYVLDEMSHAEIAAMLDITESTSRTQLYKARKLIQKSLLEFSTRNTSAV